MGSNTEHRLYDCAVKLIAREGIDSFQVRTLAREAGTSVERFYKYFRRRDNLLLRIFNDGWKLIKDCIFAELVRAGKKPEQRIAAIVVGFLRALEQNPSLVQSVCIIGMTTAGWEVRSELRETPNFKEFFKTLEGYLEDFEPLFGDVTTKEVFIELVFGMLARFAFLMSPVSGRSMIWARRDRQQALVQLIYAFARGLSLEKDLAIGPDPLTLHLRTQYNLEQKTTS